MSEKNTHMMVTRLAWMAQRLLSSKMPTWSGRQAMSAMSTAQTFEAAKSAVKQQPAPQQVKDQTSKKKLRLCTAAMEKCASA